MPSPLVSIVIPNHNSGLLLQRCLASVESQVTDHSFEVIVVDDGSDDESASCTGHFAGVALIQQSQRGAAAARNRGVRAARGDVVLFLDSDCQATPEWLNEISSPLIVGNARVTVGRFTSSQPGLVPSMIQYELRGRFDRMARHGDVDFLNSATCGFARETIDRFPFDSDFDKLEDVELSFRLARSDIPIRYVPEAVVDHHHPETLWAYLRRKWRYGKAAPRLYRMYPEKGLRDSSTPTHRRIQLTLVLMGLLSTPLSLELGAFLLALAVVFSVLRLTPGAWREAPRWGLIYPFFTLAGSASFLVGLALGMALLLFGTTKTKESPRPDHEPGNS